MKNKRVEERVTKLKAYSQEGMVTMYQGDCREILRELPDESVHCCVTSPPYWGLRDYQTAKWEGGREDCDHLLGMDRPRSERPRGSFHGGDDQFHTTPFRGGCGKCGARRIDAQIGLEKTPEEYVAQLVAVFREVKRVLRKDATLWLNLGDSYAQGSKGNSGELRPGDKQGTNHGSVATRRGESLGPNRAGGTNGFCKPKDLCGIPWLVAFALRADGWYLRQDIVWSKPNPMPESVTDRCTKAHEYIFLLSKGATYFYDAAAIKEPGLNPEDDFRRISQAAAQHKSRPDEMKNGLRERGHSRPHDGFNGTWDALTKEEQQAFGANKRSVWEVATSPFPEAHFATFPPELIKPCILAGCPANGIVLDPFFGAGTTGLVASNLNCQCIGIELNQEYLEIAAKRLSQEVFNFGNAETEFSGQSDPKEVERIKQSMEAES